MEDRLLGDQYAIKSTIGSGGMGVVYRAVGSEDGMSYAVKVLRPELARDENFLRRFRNEAAAVTRLSHPNIVRVFDVDMEADPPYIVMEYVEGRTLRELIAEEAPLAPERAAWFAAEIAAGLAHAHDHGVIHRDVSPRNVKVTPTGAVKVMDFGLAHAADATTLVETRTLMGSVHYLAPEQARGAATDGRTDVYALGVLLHELSVAQVPFDGDNPVSIVVKHLREPVPRPSERLAGLPEELEGIILRCLAKDPASRFASAKVLERECRLFSVGRWDELSPPPPQDATRVIQRGEIDALHEEQENGGREAPAAGPQGAAGRDREPEEESQTAAAGGRWALLLVLLLLLGGGAWGGWNWLAVPVVEVPNVQGMHRTDAEAVLTEAGLSALVAGEEHSAELPVNYVISQLPNADSEVRQGRTVSLVLSMGHEWVEGGVPDVVDGSARQARLALEAAGLQVETVFAHHPEAQEGIVFDQNPRSGTTVQVNEVVQIWVSEGPAPQEFALPDWRGRHRDDVLTEMALLDLVADVTYTLGEYAQNVVMDHNPAAEAVVVAGDTVVLVVSSGCESSASTALEIDGPDDGPWQVEVEIIDERSRRLIHSQEHGHGEVVALDLCWVGDAARLLIYYDGNLEHQEIVQAN